MTWRPGKILSPQTLRLNKKLVLIRFSIFISHPPPLGLGLHLFASLLNSITTHCNE